MPDVVLAVARFGFLVLLWIFVFAVAGVVRRDLFIGARSSGLVAAPRGLGPAAAGPKVKRGKAAHLLSVKEDGRPERTITLADTPITIGRAEDCTVVITDDFASAHHAQLVPRDGQWFLQDQGSTNGTYLNNAKVSGLTPVPLRVPIRIGRTSLELRS
ncbi:FHA domain-containing protein FhaB/FipA [Longispora albida]|uniref:FHA domain-containing protein FhaB/FipA n=1 Tax=Longispora albida TaxID=203523 RepID=UPI00037DF84D|nr:FHA domain-containing protein [Longispora albida]